MHRHGRNGTFLDALSRAGVVAKSGAVTKSARGFWGGVTAAGEIVVTSWTDAEAEGGFRIWRPKANYGGLKTAWDSGEIVVGRTVRLIVLQQSGTEVLGQGNRKVRHATLYPRPWHIAKFLEGDVGNAIVMPGTFEPDDRSS